MKLPIIIAIPTILFVLLVVGATGYTLFERKDIYETRFNQALSEAERLISLMQKVTEEKLAKAEDIGLINTFDVIITHDYLVDIQLIASDGYIMYANNFELTGTNSDPKLMRYLYSIRTRDLQINEDHQHFSLIYPIRQLAGNFSNHVAYIYSNFDLKPIQEQVNREVEERIIRIALFIFIVMFLLFILLLITVYYPLASLKKSFSAMAHHNYQTPVSDSLWSEFSALADQGNKTQSALSEAAKEEAFLAQIFNVSEGLFILDDKFRVKRLNNGVCRIFEKEESYLIGESALLLGLISMEDRAHLIQNGSLESEVAIVVDDSEKILLNSARRVEAEGELFYVGVLKDITQQRSEALKREKARDEFVASVSHELRTPLNGIIGMTKLLEKGPLTAKQQENISNILGSSDLLLNVINEILDFSKIEAGQLQLEMIPFNLRTAFIDLVAMFEHLAAEKSVQFNFFMSPEVPAHVRGDPIRLQQVVNNFCSNALKFTKEGSVSVTFQVVKEQSGQITLQCLVVDTGIGISEDKQAQLFEAFKQEDSSTSRRHGGTGLGLYISKQLVENMDGKIIFHSKKHVGSTFGFTVPLYTAEKQDVLNHGKEERNEHLDIANLSILVVDDNHINVEVAKGLLLDHTDNVLTAYSGREALDICQNQKVDIILMDIQMPVMDGMEALNRIRQLEGYENSIIFALTANVMKQDVERYRAHGFTEVVAKPFDIEDLVRQIHKAKK